MLQGNQRLLLRVEGGEKFSTSIVSLGCQIVYTAGGLEKVKRENRDQSKYWVLDGKGSKTEKVETEKWRKNMWERESEADYVMSPVTDGSLPAQLQFHSSHTVCSRRITAPLGKTWQATDEFSPNCRWISIIHSGSYHSRTSAFPLFFFFLSA